MYIKNRTAGWNHGAALFLRNQPRGLRLFNGGRHPAWVALTTGTAWTRWDTAFRILSWLDVADFDLAFLFLFLWFLLHVTFHLFVVQFGVGVRCGERLENVLVVIADRLHHGFV